MVNFSSITSRLRLRLLGAKTLWWDGAKLTKATATATKPLELLVGIQDQKQALLDNTAKFAEGKPALNALLWGSRGMGKSTLVKSVAGRFEAIYLVGIDRQRLTTLESLYKLLGRLAPKRFILFLDEIAFGQAEDFHGFKSLIEGSVMSQPANVLLYVTSNRRRITEHSEATAQSPFVSPTAKDALDDRTALADRFGLRLGFHSPSQQLWQEMVTTHLKQLGKPVTKTTLHQAEQWSISYGGKSGRAAELFAISV